jgi:hypothetical protein
MPFLKNSKFLLLSLGLICTFQLSAMARTNNRQKTFLSYDQFLSLSDNQKKTYIEIVRKLILDLSLNPNFVTSDGLKRTTLLEKSLEQFLLKAQAAEPEERVGENCRIKNYAELSNEDLINGFKNIRDCSEVKIKTSDPRIFKPNAIIITEKSVAEFFSRLGSGSMTPRIANYDNALAEIKVTISEIKEGGTTNGPVDPRWMKDPSDRLEVLSQQYDSGSRSILKEKKTEPVSLGTSSPTAHPPQKTLEAPKSAAKPEIKVSDSKVFKNHLQCLYAGFVVPKNSINKCSPYTLLPFESDFFDKNTFLCRQKEQIICNPLLFGFEESACEIKNNKKECQRKIPVCVFRSQDATKNCFELAQKKKTLNQTLEIWKSSEGEKLYHEFTESLEDLCDDSHLKKRKLRPAAYQDITKTCDVAFTVLKDHIKNEFLPESSLGTKKDETDLKKTGKQ